MMSLLNKLNISKQTVVDLMTIFIAIIALIISLVALRVSDRQLEITDPASSLYVNKVYFDITNRLASFLWGEEIYDYPIVAEIYNTGNQSIIITGFSIVISDQNLKSSLTTSSDHNSPRIYYSHNNSVAQNPTPINPIILEPTQKALIRSENCIRFPAISNFITRFNRNKIVIFLPDKKSGYRSPVFGWENNDEFSVASLNSFISKTIGSPNIKLLFSFLNNKNLYTISIPLNDGTNGFEKEKRDRIDFNQLLIDEILMSDIKYILKRDSILTPIYSKIKDSRGIVSSRKSYSPNSHKMEKSIEKILKPMGFDKNLIFYNAASSYMIERWNPRE